ALLIGGGFVVRATAAKQLIGPVVYLLYAFAFGLLVGPLVMIAQVHHEGIVTSAALTTGVIFLSLTAYVFVSGKDFSFMGGALAIIGGLVLATLLVGWLIGFTFGVWMTILIAMLYSAYILYDTSQILHHYPTNMHIAAAANLFANVVLLFYHVLLIFMSRDD
ncbi:MAG: Bax inhibitor-1 family protein, partial [Planctomycetes bacterium]|nr:Bax inhibitor-1 family protein [Planctomycetota bacterium]